MSKDPAAEDSKISPDTLFNGRLICRQPSRGYRFSLDAVLLANFVGLRAGARVLDLGAGCGVISLIMAWRSPEVAITALELQPSLFELCLSNIELNKLALRIQGIQGDLRRVSSLFKAASFDLVVCNPPYYKVGSGRINPASEQAAARHEITADIGQCAKAAAWALRSHGRAAFIFPARRGAALLSALHAHRLEAKRLQVVYSFPGAAGRLLMVEAVKGGGEELQIMPPFYIYKTAEGRQYTPEMTAFFAGDKKGVL
ncbi:tRNA1(Val) (adenine(37)-N6)-methyltransferase [Desulfobacterota bacterium M19]